ncbi:MAG TPA: hypothetical protein DCZ95_01885 [Verrucomicrobia bacterium]|nr:hypothetical protein [Verrucomicrobiota bacterium]
MQARYPVKVQAIRSKGRTDRFYVFIPLPLAAAIGLEAGEEFQWSLTDRDSLCVHRLSSKEGGHADRVTKKTKTTK